MAEGRLRPVSELASLAGTVDVRGVLFDLDDTLLSDGALTEPAYGALFRLKAAGMRLVAVTGRPLGWGEVLLPQWPIDAMIVENGALGLTKRGRAIEVLDPVDADERALRAKRLSALKKSVSDRFPDITPAGDAWQRRTDATWDIGETCIVEEGRVLALQKFLRSEGARTTRSSVHAHATFDAFDKASGIARILASLYQEDETALSHRYVYVGDSANDASCFSFFSKSVGVANVRRHLGRIPIGPRFVCEHPMGEGFAELANVLVLMLGRTSGGLRGE